MLDYDRQLPELLCPACAEIVVFGEVSQMECPSCGETINREALATIYCYSRELTYCGYQYRLFYEQTRASGSEIKASLGYIGDSFTFIAIAVLSGIIGNASYDIVKRIIRRIQNQSRDKTTKGYGYEHLAELSDEDIVQFINYLKDFHNGLKNIHLDIRNDIIEEILADEVAHNPIIAKELLKLQQKKKVKPKDEAKTLELCRAAIHNFTALSARGKPTPEVFHGFWRKRGRNSSES